MKYKVDKYGVRFYRNPKMGKALHVANITGKLLLAGFLLIGSIAMLTPYEIIVQVCFLATLFISLFMFLLIWIDNSFYVFYDNPKGLLSEKELSVFHEMLLNAKTQKELIAIESIIYRTLKERENKDEAPYWVVERQKSEEFKERMSR